MKISDKQIEAVMALDSEGRYRHFIKRVADIEEVWGLYDDGWAISEADDGKSIFPFWPAKEYASKCAINEWSGYHAKSIPLDEFMSDLLPQIQSDDILLGIFPNENGDNSVVKIEDLISDINMELDNY